jgi:predicted P-loop ATPase
MPPHVYTFDPRKVVRATQVYVDKEGKEKRRGLSRPDFNQLVFAVGKGHRWGDILRYNDYDNKIYAYRPPFKMRAETGVNKIQGVDVSSFRTWLEVKCDCTAKSEDISAATELIADGTHYHPIRDWLKSRKVTGSSYLDTFARDILGYDRPIAQKWFRKTMIASCARIFEPGVQVDTVLTLVGSGGKRKSSLIERLYRVEGAETFRTDLPDHRDMQKIGQALDGVWAVELAELAFVRKADVEGMKSFLTRRVERYSPKYIAGEVSRPRQCIFIGSVNQTEFLSAYDEAFRRRFWPVMVQEKLGLLSV